MDLRSWITAFKVLHERARKSDLSSGERSQYLSNREELAGALVAAQRLTLLPGQTARQSLRVARALQIDLDLLEGRVRVMTMQVSSGGFGALLAKDPGPNQAIGFTMRVPASADPIIGRVKVCDVQKRTGNFLISFAFDGALSAADQDRLEMILFDTVLQQFDGQTF